MNTRIIMSFAMAHNGWTFSHWLWERLRRHYGLYEVGDVYNDYLVLLDLPAGPGISAAERRIDPRPGTVLRPLAEIRPDDPSTDPSRPIGTRRNDWQARFEDALGQASVALVILTREFDETANCAAECDLFRREQDERRGQGRALRIVVLVLTPTDTRSLRSRFPDAEFVHAQIWSDFDKTRSDDHPERFEPLLWEKEDWKITDEAYHRLLRAIGPLV